MMVKKEKIKNIISCHISESANGTLFFNNSFPEYDDEYVGQILSDLVSDGLLIRLCRGVYLKPEHIRFGIAYPSITEIAEAIGKRDHAQVLPAGAAAMNLLGLSPQIPKNPIYLTSGSARVIKLGERTITFKRAVPKNFAINGDKRKLIVQAMKYIGEQNMTEKDYLDFRKLILLFPEKETLKKDLPAMPTWIRRHYLKTLKEI